MSNKNKLEKVSAWYQSSKGLNSFMIHCVFQEIKRYIKAPLLEIGAADGHMTELIIKEKKLNDFDIVEASSNYCDLLRKRFKNVNVFNDYLEKFSSSRKYKTLLASHVLEHVENPAKFLKAASRLLSENGFLLISVPNANSIHRLLGVEMGLIKSPTQLNEQDTKIGHYRVYDSKKLRNDLEQGGFEIINLSTSFLKFLSNSQTEKLINKKDWIHFYSLSKQFPENGSDIFAICKLKND